jgi:hypothetical protein
MCLKSIAGSYQTAMIYFLCWTFRPEKKHMNNYIPYVTYCQLKHGSLPALPGSRGR